MPKPYWPAGEEPLEPDAEAVLADRGTDRRTGFLFPILSGWTDVFQVPGKRTTGTKAQTYAITGPGWSGTLPKDVTEYKSPTGMEWNPG
jgi:hypothetical protein